MTCGAGVNVTPVGVLPSAGQGSEGPHRADARTEPRTVPSYLRTRRHPVVDRLRPVDFDHHRRVLTDRLLTATTRDLPRVVVPDLIDLDNPLEDL